MDAGYVERRGLVDRDDPRMRMRRALELDMQQALDGGIERIARRAAYHLRTGGRGQAAAERIAGACVLAIGLAVKGVLDRTIAGAATQIAFQRGAEILLLGLVERGAGENHARGAEAALERLGIEEGLLHRVKFAIISESLNGGDGMAFGPERRDQAAMHRLAIDQDGAGAAVSGVAALLDAEMAGFAQERAQTLSGAGGR